MPGGCSVLQFQTIKWRVYMKIKIAVTLIGLFFLSCFIVIMQKGTDNPTLTELEKVSKWLSSSGSINADDRSFVSDWTRGSIDFAVATTGRSLADTEFQVVSDGLAQSIAHTVLETGGIPGVQALIEADINATVQGFKLERWHWPGTLYDQLPYPFGWGQDFVQVTGNTRMEYLKNMGVALMQTVAGLNRYLDRDTLLDTVSHWKMARDANSWVDDNLYRLFPETFEPAAK